MEELLDTYLSIAVPSKGLYKDRGSRFIALAFPVSSEKQAKETIEAVRKEYHDARHCCPAYRIGLGGKLWRASDDGEPAGTAGRQILGQIDSLSLSDVLVVVVRYFGGVKLGVPGLIRAYREAARDALENAQTITRTAGKTFLVEFPYSAVPRVMKVIKEMGLQLTSPGYGATCSFNVCVRLSLEQSFLSRMCDPAVRVTET